MSRSLALSQLQDIDSSLDNARRRINQIDQLLQEDRGLSAARQAEAAASAEHAQKEQALMEAEQLVNDQNQKLSLNQERLYSGTVTNPKELEDLQLEAQSLTSYLGVLEDRQLEAMLALEQAQTKLNSAAGLVSDLEISISDENKNLSAEKSQLELEVNSLSMEREQFLENHDLPDLATYESIRSSSGGIAVALMKDASCSSCGTSIPSAIAQEVRSPANLAFCPACKRILHPG